MLPFVQLFCTEEILTWLSFSVSAAQTILSLSPGVVSLPLSLTFSLQCLSPTDRPVAMTSEEEEGLTPASAIVGVTLTPVVFTTTTAWEDGSGGGGQAFTFSSPRHRSPTHRLSPREPEKKEEEEEEGMMEVDWIEEDIVEEEEEEVGRCDSEAGCDHHDDDDDDDEGSSDASVLVVPHPEMVPVVFFCLKQTTFPRSCCIRLVSSPYPLCCRGNCIHARACVGACAEELV